MNLIHFLLKKKRQSRDQAGHSSDFFRDTAHSFLHQVPPTAPPPPPPNPLPPLLHVLQIILMLFRRDEICFFCQLGDIIIVRSLQAAHGYCSRMWKIEENGTLFFYKLVLLN